MPAEPQPGLREELLRVLDRTRQVLVTPSPETLLDQAEALERILHTMAALQSRDSGRQGEWEAAAASLYACGHLAEAAAGFYAAVRMATGAGYTPGGEYLETPLPPQHAVTA